MGQQQQQQTPSTTVKDANGVEYDVTLAPGAEPPVVHHPGGGVWDAKQIWHPDVPPSYEGQLADIGRFKIMPEDTLMLPDIAHNLVARGGRALSTIGETGSLTKAIAALFRSPAKSFGQAVGDVVPPTNATAREVGTVIRPGQSAPLGTQVPISLPRTSTSFELPQSSSLPPRAPWAPGPNLAQKIEALKNLQAPEDALEHVGQGVRGEINAGEALKPGETARMPRRQSFRAGDIEPAPKNLQQTRLGGPKDTRSTLRKGVQVEK